MILKFNRKPEELTRYMHCYNLGVFCFCFLLFNREWRSRRPKYWTRRESQRPVSQSSFRKRTTTKQFNFVQLQNASIRWPPGRFWRVYDRVLHGLLCFTLWVETGIEWRWWWRHREWRHGWHAESGEQSKLERKGGSASHHTKPFLQIIRNTQS